MLRQQNNQFTLRSKSESERLFEISKKREEMTLFRAECVCIQIIIIIVWLWLSKRESILSRTLMWVSLSRLRVFIKCDKQSDMSCLEQYSHIVEMICKENIEYPFIVHTKRFMILTMISISNSKSMLFFFWLSNMSGNFVMKVSEMIIEGYYSYCKYKEKCHSFFERDARKWVFENVDIEDIECVHMQSISNSWQFCQ